MPKAKTLSPAPPGAFPESFREQLRETLLRLDRPRALGLLTELAEAIAQQRGLVQSMEDGRRELLEKATRADSFDELGRIENVLTALETAFFVTSGSVPGLHRGCTEYRDLLAERTLSLVEAELAPGLGPPPRPYALISMGSDGREEQTLITDQDYLIVYGDGGGDAADLYFQGFSECLVERLAEVGFAKCTGDIMPTNPTWRGSLAQWKERLLAIVRYEYEDYAANLMDLIVLSDARFIAGNATIASRLIETIRDFEQGNPPVVLGMARHATEMKVGLGRFGRLWTDRVGEHRGLFNLKLLGWAPLIMNIRILAVHHGLPATSTLRRIAQLEAGRYLHAASAAELSEAYHTLTRHRINAQIRYLRGEQQDSYFIDPVRLSPDEHEALHRALVGIADLQKLIRTNFHTT